MGKQGGSRPRWDFRAQAGMRTEAGAVRQTMADTALEWLEWPWVWECGPWLGREGWGCCRGGNQLPPALMQDQSLPGPQFSCLHTGILGKRAALEHKRYLQTASRCDRGQTVKRQMKTGSNSLKCQVPLRSSLWKEILTTYSAERLSSADRGCLI